MNEGMLEPCLGENGEIYALPMKTVYHTTFYNKTMFDEYGFEEPETWDEMTAIFETLRRMTFSDFPPTRPLCRTAFTA